MNKKVHIIDLIGTHSGMHYYLDALKNQFMDSKGMEVCIRSNFATDGKGFLPNVYSGSKTAKIFNYLWAWMKCALLILRRRQDYFVYLSYGRAQDLPFLWLASLKPSHFCVDVHDLYDIRGGLSKNTRLKLEKRYRRIRFFISHSAQNSREIRVLNPACVLFEVPHFSYTHRSAKKDVVVAKEVEELFHPEKLNLLFFGHIRLSKGIDHFYSLLNALPDQKLKASVHAVIAGNDQDALIAQHALEFNDISHSILLRQVNDSELDCIFRKADLLVLPYREIAQSGVLEMAIHYRNPVLLSNLESFLQYLAQFPSFGKVCAPDDPTAFAQALAEIAAHPEKFYREEDLKKYAQREEFAQFQEAFRRDFLKIVAAKP